MYTSVKLYLRKTLERKNLHEKIKFKTKNKYEKNKTKQSKTKIENCNSTLVFQLGMSTETTYYITVA